MSKFYFLAFIMILFSVDLMIALSVVAVGPVLGLGYDELAFVSLASCIVFGLPLSILFTGLCRASGDESHG